MARFQLIPPSPATQYTTSWLLPTPILFGYRTLLTVYIFFTLLFRLFYRGDGSSYVDARASFSYFTNLTLWGLGFYFLFSSYHTFVYWRKGHVPLERWGELMRGLHAVFYTTVICFPFLVTIVYWVLLASGDSLADTYTAWGNISTHALNSLYALLELLLPNTDPSPWSHLVFLILLLALYLALAYITKATKGFYTYSFLDPNKNGSGMVAAYCFGILAAVVVVFVVTRYIIWGRNKAVNRKRDGRVRKREEEDIVEMV